mgnify:CR=1 FL=1
MIWANLSGLLPNLTFDEVQRWEGEFGACPTADSALELEIGAPLSGRDVVVNKIRWVADADGAYGVCELPDCDPETGAAPATAACEGGSLTADIRTYADVGSHASIGEKRCQDGWAMVEVDIGAGACPADEGANPCAGRRIDRLFLKVGVPHWRVLARMRLNCSTLPAISVWSNGYTKSGAGPPLLPENQSLASTGADGSSSSGAISLISTGTDAVAPQRPPLTSLFPRSLVGNKRADSVCGQGIYVATC